MQRETIDSGRAVVHSLCAGRCTNYPHSFHNSSPGQLSQRGNACHKYGYGYGYGYVYSYYHSPRNA